MISYVERFREVEDRIREKHGTGAEEVFYLLFRKNNGITEGDKPEVKEIEEKLLEKGFLERRGEDLVLSQHGMEVLGDLREAAGDLYGALRGEGISWREMGVFFSTMKKIDKIRG